ncbi:amidase [Annulohypoxylon maeteangense]|uniref:amidase n=1 Tax=Annulohypoxylon maeteangense TaxID=1927788 RepID=UPI002008291B|nr:amidase [Annulohypoxylon maeteangense]KAI0889517.1 amidase [Annulohypoxylon maeteangense]
MAPAAVTIANGATWQDVAADRQRYRDATIAEVHPPVPELKSEDIPLNTTGIPKKLLTEEEIKITGTNVEELVEKITSGEWTSTAVTKAFLRRAGLAQKLANCITELLPKKALERAAELDKYLADSKKPIGPLHGVPISVKEHMGFKGEDANAGFVGWVGQVPEEDSLILQYLWDAGAVFYARTTQPQTLMHLETSSNLYGATVNPCNTTLTAGGSSGGEGALIGLRGSILGIGSDIGGSIRSPAANNGVFGYKPTTLRLPGDGWTVAMHGAESIIGTTGPLSTSLEGLRLFSKVLIDQQPWLKQPSLTAMNWKDSAEFFPDKKLRVGVMYNDDVVRPHPPILRALTELVGKLKHSPDIEIVDWSPWKHDLAWSIIASLYFADGGADVRAAIELSGEPWLPLSKFILVDNPRVKEHTITSLWEAVSAREEYRTKYAQLWNETASSSPDARPIDVILCPAGPGVAPKLETSRYWGYTSQWNLLDYPAVVFPVADKVDTLEREKPFEYPEDYVPLGEEDKYIYDLWKKHGTEGYKDAPISLQLVGRRNQDEQLLKATQILLEKAGLPAVVPS